MQKSIFFQNICNKLAHVLEIVAIVFFNVKLKCNVAFFLLLSEYSQASL